MKHICNRLLSGIFLMCLLMGNGFGQNFKKLGLTASVEAGGVVATDSSAPFWIRTNQFGIVPRYAPAGILQAAIAREYRQPDSAAARRRLFDWGVTVNPVLNFTKYDGTKLLLPEANLRLRLGRIELYGGRRREVMGLGDTTMTSGFWSVSGNAMPMPKLQLSTIGYIPLHFLKDFVSFRAAFAHGWYDVDYIQGARLHQKFLYIRLGAPRHRLQLTAGINHQVQWAGHSEELKKYPDLALDGELPSSWRFFPNVVFAYTSKDWYKKKGYTSYDSYRLGNHLGSFDAAVEYRTEQGKWMAYHQHAYEDVSGIVFKNFPDGLWGLSFSASGKSGRGIRIRALTFEWLTTMDQSGSTFVVPGSTYQGADAYFNHGQYTKGWTYRGRAIGMPFNPPRTDVVNPSSWLYLPNTKLNMFYVGAKLEAGEGNLFYLRASYSDNYGAAGYLYDQPPGQFSGMLGAEIPLDTWYGSILTARLAMDSGKFFANTAGLYIGLKKHFR